VDRAEDVAPAPETKPPKPPGDDEKGAGLTRSAVLGAIWSIGTSVGSRGIGLVGTLLLTRFLDPETYGEASLAYLVVASTQMISNCGLPQYLVAKPKEGRSAAFHASFYYVLLGVLGLIFSVLFRHPLGAALLSPNLPAYIPGFALAGLCERFVVIQDAIQVRQMRFRSLSLQRSMGEALYAVVSVTLAWRGFGGYAIVWASIARSGSRLISLSATTDRREWLEPCQITWQQTRDMFRFGLPMSVGAIANYGARRWDNILIARYFGPGTQGVYNLAYNFADIPATQIGETIGDVLVPSFAKMESDERRKKALVLALRIMMLIVAPLAVGLGMVAPELVRTFFNDSWSRRSIGVMMMILAGLSVVRPIGWVGNSYLQVKDRPRIIMILEVGKTATLLVLISLFARIGSVANYHVYYACGAVGVAFGLSAFSYLYAISKVDGTPLGTLVLPLFAPVLACLPMAFAVFEFQRLVAQFAHVSHPVVLVGEILVGIVVFLPSAFLIAPGPTRELIGLLRSARARRREKKTDDAAPPVEKAA
jgi:PST family polysaccharide transporter